MDRTTTACDERRRSATGTKDGGGAAGATAEPRRTAMAGRRGATAATESPFRSLLCKKPKPGPTNTGVKPGVTLKASKGIKVTKDGDVVENLDIDGEIEVAADNVTIRNVKITSGSYYPRSLRRSTQGARHRGQRIIGTSDDGVTSAVSFCITRAPPQRCMAARTASRPTQTSSSRTRGIHDLRNGPDQHNDGVQSTGGKGVAAKQQHLRARQRLRADRRRSCMVSTEDLTIECNWLDGGGYRWNIRGQGATKPKNTKIINNRFGRKQRLWSLDARRPESHRDRERLGRRRHAHQYEP